MRSWMQSIMGKKKAKTNGYWIVEKPSPYLKGGLSIYGAYPKREWAERVQKQIGGVVKPWPKEKVIGYEEYERRILEEPDVLPAAETWSGNPSTDGKGALYDRGDVQEETAGPKRNADGGTVET